MNYFSADYHFGDDRVKLFPRPFADAVAAREGIIKEHNKVLTANDTLYVLGDVAVKAGELEHLKRINGRKILIRGNYDVFEEALYRKYFDAIHDELDLELNVGGTKLPVHLTHYPSKGIAERFNLVGHVHGAWRLQKNMLNVGIDTSFFQPVSEALVLFYLKAIESVYDQDVWCAEHPANTAHKARGKPGCAAPGTLKKRVVDVPEL